MYLYKKVMANNGTMKKRHLRYFPIYVLFDGHEMVTQFLTLFSANHEGYESLLTQ